MRRAEIVHRGLVSCLHYLCWVVHSGVQHILCCVLVFRICPRLCTLCYQFFLDCPFLTVPTVFSNIYFKQYDEILYCQHEQNISTKSWENDSIHYDLTISVVVISLLASIQGFIFVTAIRWCCYNRIVSF